MYTSVLIMSIWVLKLKKKLYSLELYYIINKAFNKIKNLKNHIYKNEWKNKIKYIHYTKSNHVE